ncbi:SusC/RagA family TonB-linked outer membrane protein [Pedobacter sp. HDW13]|uniref:SusC/RagA family TonB-linked outer membrane protein n=1 Tax=unclassified Pedobacter TaxID=2628915 RepID=UPI000F5959BC|nr:MULTISPECIES: SusC/RagA family TonB-linked outer membrane protein [unclassified Pedobacter]QIL39512.1 SusC/RagA family TonB-linked outer membrane protein [Pedobacter sp. HDW13]RQO78601.1 SusC/RagA family TonB-linked outer membrane protein [Pedobacter sp. KBW01]
MKQKLLLILMVTVLSYFNALAQNKTITGKVVDADDGLPLPGVSIKIKGTTQVTQTTGQGTFSMSAPQNAQALILSYVGYTEQEVKITGETLTIRLASSSKNLQDVIVVAYGTSKKEAITGSVATMSAKQLDNRIITNVTNVLAGVAPGVVTTSGNGQPGSSSAIRIRGFGSISASNSPLFVLDGSVYDGELGDINANDIESISLLKDASSSALYGSRAANGVVIITTKKGKSTTPTLNATYSQGFSKRGIPEYDRIGALDYYPLMWQALKNSLVYPSSGTGISESAAATQATNTIQGQLVYNPFNVPNNQIVGVDGKLNPNAQLLYSDFDWYKQASRVGKRTEFNVNSSAKGEKTDYYFSMNYLKDNGYLIKTDFERFNARINANTQLRPWLKTGINLAGSLSNGNLAQDASTGSATAFVNVFNFARGIGPIYPVHAYDASGNPILTTTGEQWYDYGGHPGAVNRPQGASAGRNVIYETMLNDVLSRRLALNGRAYAEIKFLKDFTFKPTISIDFINAYSTEYRNSIVGDGSTVGGSSTKRSTPTQSYTFNQVLSYSKTFGKHSVNALVGHENYDYDWRRLSATKQSQILDGNTEFPNFVTPSDAGGYKDTYRVESYFGKAGYSYMDKYFVDASIRRDGTSRLSKQSRWGTFFSAGASWAINKEDFMNEVKWINDLRLKASYGEVGNDNLIDATLVEHNSLYYNYQAFYELGWNNGSEPGLLLATAATPDLKWESVNTFNTGIAFSLFNNRLKGEIEYFKRGSSNLLFAVPQPLSDPITSIRRNIGSMYNTGIDLQLSGDILRSENFNWNLLSNWSWLKNKITKMPAETPTVTSGTKRLEVGRDIYAYYLRQWAGVDPTDGSALFEPNAGVTTDLRTVNGRVLTTNINNARSDYSGSAIPDLYGSVTNTFNYKNFGLSFLISYQIGGKFYDSNYQSLMSTTYGSALHTDVLNSWMTPGQVTDIPRLDIGRSTQFNGTSSRWLIDASYIAFRNVNLSYTLPQRWIKGATLSSVRVFAAGENLGLISKRKGMDPTESFTGVNTTNYVPSRMISFGINVSL